MYDQRSHKCKYTNSIAHFNETVNRPATSVKYVMGETSTAKSMLWEEPATEARIVGKMIGGISYGGIRGTLKFSKDRDVQHASRSAERRGGKECVSTCRARWARYH